MDQQTKKAYSLLSLRRNYQRPHTHYARLRMHDSIYYDTTSLCWLVTGHTPAMMILDDPRFSAQLGAESTSSITTLNKQMLFMDGDRHTQIQYAMLRPLAEMAKKIPDEIRAFAHALLVEKQQAGEMDLVGDFASKISLFAIACILGIPGDDWQQLTQLERWSDTFGDFTSGYFHGNMQDIQNLETYFSQLLVAKRHASDDGLLSTLATDQQAFPDEGELVANCMMIFAAGRLTSKKVFSNGIPLLLQNWDTMRKEYRAHPDTFPKLLSEELLRMVTPTRYLMRQATEDVDLSPKFQGQHLIHKGDRILIFLEAANRDPALFKDPDMLFPQRRPNKHLAFGFGSHQCPGALLARIELQSTLEELLQLSKLCLKPGHMPHWNPNPNLGGYSSYQVLFRF
ncbi:MAG TPA: cytochrome P450 [Ktedonobacteraceae bacterium]|nr:cytochrome P450 [Ktedonobacteraceae bacterium]